MTCETNGTLFVLCTLTPTCPTPNKHFPQTKMSMIYTATKENPTTITGRRSDCFMA